MYMKTKKGGRFYGKGAYGAAVGNPRFPCFDENVEDIEENDEVGKVIVNESKYNEEVAILQRFQEVLSTTTIQKLRKYFVLPIKFCKLDKYHIDRIPVFKTDKWNQDRHGEIPYDFGYRASQNDFTFDGVPMREMYQIIYPRGEQDLFDDIQMVYTNTRREHALAVLKNIGNLFTGLQLLHKQDMVHMDIKIENAISIEGTYKFIDLAQCTQITRDRPLNNRGFLNLLDWIKRQIYYFGWSSLTIFAEAYISGKVAIDYRSFFMNHLLTTNIEGVSHLMGGFQIIEDIIRERRFGMDDETANMLYTKYIGIIMVRFFGMTGRRTPEITKISLDTIKENIMYIKSRIYENVEHFESDEAPEHIRYMTEDIKLFLRNINEYFELPENNEQYQLLRMDYILKSSDLYAMGRILIDYLGAIRADIGANDILLEVFTHALNIMSIEQVPEDWTKYNRKTHFDDIYNDFAQIFRKIVRPRVSSRTVGKTQRKRTSPAKTSKRRPRK